MAAYNYDSELAMLNYLQEQTKGTPLSFQWSNRRVSAGMVASNCGVNTVQGRFLQGRDVLEIFFYKNFMVGSGGWRKYLAKLSGMIEGLVKDGKITVGTRYYTDTKETLPIGQRRQSAMEKEMAAQAAASAQDKEDSGELGALQRELLKHFPKTADFDELEGGESLKRFYESMKDGKHILIPRRTWGTLGLSQAAAQKKIETIYPGPSATLLSVDFESFQELAEGAGFKFTEGAAELAPRLKNIQTPDQTKAVQYAERVRQIPERKETAEDKELKLLENHDMTYKNLSERVSAGRTLSDDEKKLYNVLKRVVENGEISLLAMKKRKLKEVIAKQLEDYEKFREKEIKAIAGKYNPEDTSIASTVAHRKAGVAQVVKLVSDQVIQVKKEDTYWRLVSISGTKIPYS